MGMLYVGLCLAAGLLAFLPFSSSLAEGVRMASANNLAPIMTAMRAPLLVFTALYVIIAAVFWHAPVLVGWHGLRLLQALFFSGIACWRDKWPFLVYGVVWILVFLFIDLCIGLLIGMGVPDTLAGTLQVPSPSSRAACCIAASTLPIPPCSGSMTPTRVSTTATARTHSAPRQGFSPRTSRNTRPSRPTNATSMA